MMHRLANELVAEARENGCTVIAFEDLTDICERTGASWGRKWAFDRLYEYVEYKAEELGITVDQIDPKNTSRRCSYCGFIHPDNRTGGDFECLKCGYKNHADYKAAKNIGLRYIRRNQNDLIVPAEREHGWRRFDWPEPPISSSNMVSRRSRKSGARWGSSIVEDGSIIRAEFSTLVALGGAFVQVRTRRDICILSSWQGCSTAPPVLAGHSPTIFNGQPLLRGPQ
jgi:IS605 OrfB family transposase